MLEETSTNIYENLDGKQAAMTESMSKSNERALATCITLGFDTNQEEVGKIETKKIDEDSVNVSLHKESRARAVKRVKPIGMTIDKEEADEKEFTKSDEATAIVSTTENKIDRRASSKPRTEGLAAKQEDIDQLEDFQVSGQSGSISVHQEERSVAVKKGKTIGTSINEDRAQTADFQTEKKALANVKTSEDKIDQRASAQPLSSGFDTYPEEAVAIDEFKADETLGTTTVHRESKMRAIQKEKPVGQHVEREETLEQTFSEREQAVATVSKTDSHVNKRAASKPRTEGITGIAEDIGNVVDLNIEGQAGSMLIHKSEKSRAIKKDKPFGENISKEKAEEAIYSVKDEEMANISTTTNLANLKAQAKPRVEGIDAKQESVSSFEEPNVGGQKMNITVHKDKKAKAVKKAKPIGMNVKEEKTKEQIFTEEKEAIALESVESRRIDIQDDSKPRYEGIAAPEETADYLENFSADSLEINTVLHTDIKDRALKQDTQSGLSVSEETVSFDENTGKTRKESVARIAISSKEADLQAQARTRIEGHQVAQEEPVEFEAPEITGMIGSVSVHRDSKGQATKKDKNIGQNVNTEKVRDQEFQANEAEIAVVTSTESKATELASRKPVAVGTEDKKEVATAMDNQETRELTGQLSIHKDKPKKATKKEKQFGVSKP